MLAKLHARCLRVSQTLLLARLRAPAPVSLAEGQTGGSRWAWASPSLLSLPAWCVTNTETDFPFHPSLPQAVHKRIKYRLLQRGSENGSLWLALL